MNNPELRKYFRSLRREIDASEQQRHAEQLGEHINSYLGFRSKQKVAAYLAVQGEISLGHWIAQNLKRHQIFLPRLYEPVEPRLRFAPIDENTRWMKNRFGINEPHCSWSQTLPCQQLDIVLVPLVAFDRNGHRLGMGGGYYDRSTAFRKHRRHWRKPLLIGMAHSLQEHPALAQNPWDVALDAVITEREIIRPRPSN